MRRGWQAHLPRRKGVLEPTGSRLPVPALRVIL
jgi:hypothetical protein